MMEFSDHGGFLMAHSKYRIKFIAQFRSHSGIVPEISV